MISTVIFKCGRYNLKCKITHFWVEEATVLTGMSPARPFSLLFLIYFLIYSVLCDYVILVDQAILNQINFGSCIQDFIRVL